MYCEPLSGHAVTSGIDHEVLAIDEAEPPQLVEQREMMRRVAWTGVQSSTSRLPKRSASKYRRRSSPAPTRRSNEAPRVHYASRRCGGVADCGARAAAGDAGDWLSWRQ